MSSNFQKQLSQIELQRVLDQWMRETFDAQTTLIVDTWLYRFAAWYDEKHVQRKPVEASSENCAFHLWEQIDTNKYRCKKKDCGKVVTT